MTRPEFIFVFNSVRSVSKDYYPDGKDKESSVIYGDENFNSSDSGAMEEINSEPEIKLKEGEVMMTQSDSTVKVDEALGSPEQTELRLVGFDKVFADTKYWVADWGNDIKAAISKAPCKDKELVSEGYAYRAYSSLPASKVQNPAHAWYKFDDRAVTVAGCWLHKGDGLVHFKMKRKKDNRLFEQDINLQDGSWKAISNVVNVQ